MEYAPLITNPRLAPQVKKKKKKNTKLKKKKTTTIKK